MRATRAINNIYELISFLINFKYVGYNQKARLCL